MFSENAVHMSWENGIHMFNGIHNWYKEGNLHR